MDKFGKQSICKLSQLIGRSKSSTHRHIQAQERRNQHPKSSHGETDSGSAWLRLLVFATLYSFGLKSGVGADALSQFFKLIRIDTHVGVSASALRNQLQLMEALLPQFQENYEQQIEKQPLKITAGLDETLFSPKSVL